MEAGCNGPQERTRGLCGWSGVWPPRTRGLCGWSGVWPSTGIVWLIWCLALKRNILEYGPLDGSVGGCVLYATWVRDWVILDVTQVYHVGKVYKLCRGTIYPDSRACGLRHAMVESQWLGFWCEFFWRAWIFGKDFRSMLPRSCVELGKGEIKIQSA